jgi:hypothetical protein
MTEKNKYFYEDLDLRIPSRLSNDLKAIFEPQAGVPPEIDRAVMDRAHKYFSAVQSSQGRRRRVHWAWRVAAAAAVIIFAFSLDLTKQTGPTTESFSISKTQAIDIDRNGRVDILDAFKLARHIESADRTETAWDVNGDGQIDRSDVDMVALTAVRLDKGVI